MDSYSIRFASGRISPNLDQQVGDCWLDTTGELRRARAQAAIRPEMRCPCHGASGRGGTDDLPLLGKRSIQLHPDFQANAAVPIDGDVAPARACCARTAFQTSPQHCGTTRESSDALVWRRMTARGTLSSWSNWTAEDVNGLFLIISDQEMPMIGFMRLNQPPPSLW